MSTTQERRAKRAAAVVRPGEMVSTDEIGRRLNVAYEGARIYTRAALATRTLRIGRWTKQGGPWQALLTLADGKPSVPRPMAQPKAPKRRNMDDYELPQRIVRAEGINPAHVEPLRERRAALGVWAGLT